MKSRGRPRVTTEKVDQRIYKLAGSDNIATTDDIHSILKRQNIGISQETIRRRLKEAGAKFSLPISKPFLTENHRYDRLRWAQATCDIDWNQVIFSAEATICLNPLKRHVWHSPGKKKSSSNSEESDKGECVGLLFEQWVWSYLLLPRKFQRRHALRNL